MTQPLPTHRVDDLVASCADIATRLARRYSNGPGVDPDLEQAALVGVVAAATRYDPSVGPFRPFALATALGELKKHLRNAGWAVGVPRRIQEASVTVARANEQLEQQLGRSPTPAQVAEHTGLSVEDVLLALRAHNGRFIARPEYPDDEVAIGPDDRVEQVLDLRSAASGLGADDLELLRMRFVDELTQREIAERLGSSQPQIHRRLAAALSRLRAVLDPPAASDSSVDESSP